MRRTMARVGPPANVSIVFTLPSRWYMTLWQASQVLHGTLHGAGGQVGVAASPCEGPPLAAVGSRCAVEPSHLQPPCC